MSISERVTRSLSTLLIAAVAATTVGGTAAGWAGSPCSPQEHSCTPQASLTCCRHSSPDPFDAARLPNVAPPPGSPSHGSLMDLESPITCPCCGHTTSHHPLQRLDLNILHQTFLI